MAQPLAGPFLFSETGRNILCTDRSGGLLQQDHLYGFGIPPCLQPAEVYTTAQPLGIPAEGPYACPLFPIYQRGHPLA